MLEQALDCNEEMTDVWFELDGRVTFRGHRSMMGASSEEFKAMFRIGMSEAKTGVVHVRGVSVESFKGFLEWVYLGKIIQNTHIVCCIRQIDA